MNQLQENKRATIVMGIVVVIVSLMFFLQGWSSGLEWNKYILFIGGSIIFAFGVGLIIFGLLGFKPEPKNKEWKIQDRRQGGKK